MERYDGRAADELRPTTLEPGFMENADGSVLISQGDTKVICTAVIEEKVPSFLRGQNQGWISAEYNMLPASTLDRKPRDRSGRIDGRNVEIQRLIGRALRSAVDLEKLDGYTIWIDCDVIQADGGTRTASITGGFLAMQEAINNLIAEGALEENPIKNKVAAISVGIPNEYGEPVLDLNYDEDKGAVVDMNVVMTDDGDIIEIQGTGEERPFNKEELGTLLGLAEKGISELFETTQNETTNHPSDE